MDLGNDHQLRRKTARHHVPSDGNSDTTYEIHLLKIKSQPDRVSRYSSQFRGNTGHRGTYSVTEPECRWQNVHSKKL